jgi:hypothetical protein
MFCGEKASDAAVRGSGGHGKSVPLAGPIIYSIDKMPGGQKIELLLIPPSDWDHPGRFMADCRRHGIRIR